MTPFEWLLVALYLILFTLVIRGNSFSQILSVGFVGILLLVIVTYVANLPRGGNPGAITAMPFILYASIVARDRVWPRYRLIIYAIATALFAYNVNLFNQYASNPSGGSDWAAYRLALLLIALMIVDFFIPKNVVFGKPKEK